MMMTVKQNIEKCVVYTCGYIYSNTLISNCSAETCTPSHLYHLYFTNGKALMS